VELVKLPARGQLRRAEKLTADAEDILRRLDLPFRTMRFRLATWAFLRQDYDIEVWLRDRTDTKDSSCSNFEAFQARRAGIRFRGGKKAEFVHTLNGSGLAVGRTWVAIIENYQQRTAPW